MRFTGKFAELEQKLSCLGGKGSWSDLNENQKQFRHQNGGILNWYASTGTINFQGPSPGRPELEAAVKGAMNVEALVDGETASAPAPADGLVDLRQVPAETLDIDSFLPAGGTRSATAVAGAQGYLGQKYSDSELVIGLVGAVGTELKLAIDFLLERLRVFKYEVVEVRVSTDIIPQVVDAPAEAYASEYARIRGLMDLGNEARRTTGDNSVLALGVAAKISADRPTENGSPKPFARRAYVVNSLKHPEEIARLREIYPEAFYVIGVHADAKRRHDYLTETKRLSDQEAVELMRRDEDEHLPYGQRTSDAFHLSDFFVRIDENHDKLRNSVFRILDVLFGGPYITPTFDEYAMFMAFAAALKSADLSRQVGAVIARERQILSTGANDCPKYGGGGYWAEYDHDHHDIRDAPDGRDYMRGEDSNRVEQQRIIEDILTRAGDAVSDRERLRSALEASRLADITEYGRMVHAEMEALLALARGNVSSVGAALYGTTFPCHNCAKHIVAAGIKRVVYIEPYPKSKAAEFHSDSISLGFSDDEKTVHFEPFVGVGPRRFFDLFSMRLGSGYPLKRKDNDGQVVQWTPEGARLRIQMLPASYVELELVASSLFNAVRKKKETNHDGK
jgi:deoxycytidylate deaminase